jgi:hypothetical protein
MEQKVQAQTLSIRELSIQEVVAMAIHRRRRLLKEGKTSLRVVVPLRPDLVPPPSGQYSTALGEVVIRSVYKPVEGRWLVVVKLPSNEGFTIADHISTSPNTPPAK